MIRFIVKEVYVGAVVHAGGQPETRIVSFDGDQDALERFLRYEDQPNKKRPDYVSREIVGIELLRGKRQEGRVTSWEGESFALD